MGICSDPSLKKGDSCSSPPTKAAKVTAPPEKKGKKELIDRLRQTVLYILIPIILSILTMFILRNGKSFFSSSGGGSVGAMTSFKVVGHCIAKDTSLPLTGEGHRCGEDAWRIATAKDGRYLFSVADGVGGWRESGGDSSFVSNGLLDAIKDEFLKTTTTKSLIEISEKAFKSLVGKGISKGSTTLTLLSIQDQLVKVMNLGDSGALIIRPSQKAIIFRTKPGQQGFNTPHQIGFGFSGEPQGSIRMQATMHTPPPLQKGDIILLGTDGLFDNLYDQDILAHLLQGGTTQQLAKMAQIKGQDSMYMSPFARSTGGRYIGGKNDDISLIVAKAL